jgi:hypothetical protein
MAKSPLMEAWGDSDRDWLEIKRRSAAGVQERNPDVHAMMTCYNKATDCLHVQIRTLPATQTIDIAQDIWVDYADDLLPTGYSVRNASAKSEFIGQLILGHGADRKLTLKDLADLLKNHLGDWQRQWRHEGAAAIVTRQLEHRFGPLPEWAQERIADAEPTPIEEWAVRLLDAPSLDDALR